MTAHIPPTTVNVKVTNNVINNAKSKDISNTDTKTTAIPIAAPAVTPISRHITKTVAIVLCFKPKNRLNNSGMVVKFALLNLGINQYPIQIKATIYPIAEKYADNPTSYPEPP